MTTFNTWDDPSDTWDDPSDTWDAGTATSGPLANPTTAGTAVSSVGSSSGSAQPISPFSVDVEFFGTAQPNVGPNHVRITQQEYAHDLITMDVWNDDVTNSSYASGMPFAITYGRPTVQRTLFGYVNDAGRTNNHLSTAAGLFGRASTSIRCVGASWAMNQRGTQSWTNYTAAQVVSEIAAKFGLAANVVDDGTVWPSLQMNGAKYWDFCVMLAKRIGYTFYCSALTIVFKPRQTNTNAVGGLMAYYDYLNNPWACPIFSPNLGATGPTGGELATRQLAGINPRTVQPFLAQTAGIPSNTPVLGTAANSSIFTKTMHDTVDTQDEAQAKTNGAGLTNQLYLTATAYAPGDPLVAQGALIYVVNANGSQNGLWYVTKVVHTVDNLNYTMDLCLGRDSLGATANIIPVVAVSNPQTGVISSNGLWLAL